MPILVSPIQNPYQSVDRPCVDKVVHQLINEGSLIPYHIYVHETQVSEGRRLSQHGQSYMPGQISVEVKATFEYPEQSNWALNRRWKQYIPYIHDKSLSVGVYPIHLDQEVRLAITYVSDSIERLHRLKNMLRVKQAMGWTGSEHTLDYNVIFDREVMDLLSEIHTLREGRYPYNEAFAEWVAGNSDASIHVVQGGRHQEPAYAHKQVLIQGIVDGDLEPVEEVNEGIFSFTFYYRYRHSRTMATVVEYPIQIHQQLLSAQYTVIRNSERPQAYAFSDTPMIRGLSTPEDISQDTIRIPPFDRQPITRFPQHHHPIWTALIELPNPVLPGDTLFNLLEIDDIRMHPGVLDAIRTDYHAAINIPYRTPFLLTIHRDNHLMHWDYLRMDNALNVILHKVINPRYNYRVSLCLVTNLSALSDEQLKPLQSPAVAEIMSQAINRFSDASVTATRPVNYPMIPSDLNNHVWLRHVAPLLDTGVSGVDDWTSATTGHRRPTGIVGYRTAMVASVNAFYKA